MSHNLDLGFSVSYRFLCGEQLAFLKFLLKVIGEGNVIWWSCAKTLITSMDSSCTKTRLIIQSTEDKQRHFTTFTKGWLRTLQLMLCHHIAERIPHTRKSPIDFFGIICSAMLPTISKEGNSEVFLRLHKWRKKSLWIYAIYPTSMVRNI